MRLQNACRRFSTSAPRPLRVCFFGTDAVSVPCLAALVESVKGTGPHAGLVSRLGVVTLDRRPLAHSKHHCTTPVAQVAEKEALPTWLIPSGLKSLAHWAPDRPLESWDVGVVTSFGFKLPVNILNTLEGGAINMHPSLLPRYRGAAPIPHALLNGDAVTGVSVIHVDPRVMDSGSILKQVEVPILRAHTASR